ncbi:alpha-1,6-mannosyltransferase subunit [Pholiota molesta]|nr:alpha-1,6-mannosyltransferase subunit [Pholiota molesta]
MSIVQDAVFFLAGWAHVVLAPYTKVEESFNLHAVHDVLMYGVGPKSLHNKYDHFVFPGAVPRTFVGSVLLAWLTKPVIWMAARQGYLSTKFDMQVLARLVLASLNAWVLCLIRRSTGRRFGTNAGVLFTLLTCSQFHYLFWMGRTIPNMFAAIPVNFATYLLLDREYTMRKPSEMSIIGAISLLTFTAVVFRAEVALLLGPLCLHLLITRRITFSKLIRIGLVSGLVSLALTVLVDSYFWKKPLLWPEFSGIYFNVIQGKSAEWGTSPRLTYITSYLPKLLLGALPLSLIGYFIDLQIRTMMTPHLAFIALISCLGHKEWRFIIYTVPVFNVAAARAARYLFSVSRYLEGLTGRLLYLGVVGIVCGNFAITLLSINASMHNYPGGEALYMFHQLYPADTYSTPHVHISNLAAQTGASLFLHLNAPPYPPSLDTPDHPPWTYNKTESLTPQALSASASRVTHLVSEVAPADDRALDAMWRTVGVVRGFEWWAVDWEVLKGRGEGEGRGWMERVVGALGMVESEKLWVLERNGFRRLDI